MIKFQLSPQDFQTVMKALSQMPLGESMQAFMNMQRQLAENQPRTGVQVTTPPEAPAAQPNGAADGEPR